MYSSTFLPRTSSGKIRRSECRQRYLAGSLEELYRSTDAPGPGTAARLLTRIDLLDANGGWLRQKFTELRVIEFENFVDSGEEYETFALADDELAAAN